MSRLRAPFYFTCIFLCILFSGSYNASVAQKALERSLQLFQQDEYALAAVLAERAYFEAANDSLKARSKLIRAEALKAQQAFGKAATELSGLYLSVSDSIQYALYYQSALNYYLNDEFSLGKLQLQKIGHFLKGYTVPKPYYILKPLILVELEDYGETLTFLHNNEHFTQADSTKQDSINLLITMAMNRKKKIPGRAEWFSTFVPGSGQVYAGYVGEGIASFLLNTGSIAFMGYNLWLTNYITSFAIGPGLLQQFYLGGRRRAKYLAEKRNHIEKRIVHDQFKDLWLRINAETP